MVTDRVDEEMRALLLRRRGTGAYTPHALSTAEGIIAGLVAGTSTAPRMSGLRGRCNGANDTGSITTLTTNPIWTVQTAQSTRSTLAPGSSDGVETKKVKPSALQAAQAIYDKDGITGFWRGIGPALILVINPVIQVSPTPSNSHIIASCLYIMSWVSGIQVYLVMKFC